MDKAQNSSRGKRQGGAFCSTTIGLVQSDVARSARILCVQRCGVPNVPHVVVILCSLRSCDDGRTQLQIQNRKHPWMRYLSIERYYRLLLHACSNTLFECLLARMIVDSVAPNSQLNRWNQTKSASLGRGTVRLSKTNNNATLVKRMNVDWTPDGLRKWNGRGI